VLIKAHHINKILVGGTVTIGQSAAQALGINWMANVIVRKVNI